MSRELFVQTIGTVAIDFDGRRLGPSAGRPFALLLYLASRGGQPSSRQVVQDLLFPASIRERAHSLRQLLYRLRRLEWPVESDDDQIKLAVDHVSIDWQNLLNAGTVSEADLEQLARGLFPGYIPSPSEGFQEWFDAERADVGRRLSRVLTTQLAERRRAGRWDLVETTARALLALDPLSEEGTLAKAEALAVSGSKSAALELIDEYLQDVGEQQQPLRVVPAAVRRRISERLPEDVPRSVDERQFVGREESMRQLGALGTSTRAGRQQSLLLWGEPGVGKTRLVVEYRALAALQGNYTVLLSCQPHDVFRPLGILGDLVVQLLAAPGALGCDPGARSLLERLVKANKQVDDARESTVAEVSIAAVVRSLSDLLSAVALESPVLVFVDDAQWIDDASQTAIVGAFATRSSRRSSLVLTSRERPTPTAAEAYADSIVSARLNPLDRAAALVLAQSLLSSSHTNATDEVARQIVEQARGNPFVIRTLCAHYLATDDSASLEHTLTELLTRRLDRLPPDTRRALETAVILAKNCTLDRLQRLLEIPRQGLLSIIEELDDQGLIDVTDGYLLSSHALLADVVIERMSGSVLRLLHGASAQLLHQDVDASANAALLWDCAEHWRRSGNDERAIAVLMECADRSAETGRATDAVRTMRRALTLDTPDERRLEIVEKALKITWDSHVHVEARFFLSELARLRGALGRQVHLHDVYEMLEIAVTKSDGTSSDFRRIILQLRNCLSAPDASPRHHIYAAYQLLIFAELMVDPDASRSAYQRIVEEFENVSETEVGSAKRQSHHMIYHGGFGDPEQARAAAREVVLWARSDSLERYAHLVNAAFAQFRVAPPDEAEETLRFALERARRYEFVLAEASLGLTLGRLYWSTERLENCIAQHRAVAQLLPRCADGEVNLHYNLLGARLATRDGRYREAAEYIGHARIFADAKLTLPDLWLRCCELDIRLATGTEPVPDSELSELLSLHLRARGIGLQDDVMATVLKCLERNGRSSEGRRLLHEYLNNYRRDGFPVPSWLRIAELTPPDRPFPIEREWPADIRQAIQ